MTFDADLIIVGSGPAGANAAKAAVDEGNSVLMLDVGNHEPELEESIPRDPFSVLRQSDYEQQRYFVGSTFESEADRNDRLGSHFTAPRAYITKDVRELLPVESETFFPVQSLALGGLGVGWGAGCQKYEPFELERAGMPPVEMTRYYDEVVRDIGVSGAVEDDTAPHILAPAFLQPPSEIDTNSRTILDLYQRRRSELLAAGFKLGRDSLAMLTRPMSRPGIERGANPYTDMDFYGTADYSIYRPKYTIIELQQHRLFRYRGEALVQRFDESDDRVTVTYMDRSTGTIHRAFAKKLLLAAGAINSARIALRSRALYNARQPVLANPMHYMPCINLRMLGRAAEDRRHSMGQLLAVYTPAHRLPEHVIIGTISYRSLLLYRIVRQMPLPPALGILLARTLVTSLTMMGVHHPEAASEEKWIELRQTSSSDVLVAGYNSSDRERALMKADLRGLVRCLWKLRCVPLAIFATNPGSSIHYAGTVPVSHDPPAASLTSDSRGKLNGNRHTYLADSASWTYLPAKGLTLTLMANARRIAHEASQDLRASSA